MEPDRLRELEITRVIEDRHAPLPAVGKTRQIHPARTRVIAIGAAFSLTGQEIALPTARRIRRVIP